MGVSETYFLRVGPQGRLFTWLEADDAGGSEAAAGGEVGNKHACEALKPAAVQAA